MQEEITKEDYIGNCNNSFNRIGKCIANLPYSNVTEFEQAKKHAIEVDELEFNHNFTIPFGIKQIIADHEVTYLYDERNDLYMICDIDDNVHYFFR